MQPLSARQKRFLYEQVAFGHLRWIAKPIYDATLTLLLAFNRVIDTFSPVDKSDLNCLSIVIKTFERDKAVSRLVRSIRRRYPTIDIVVVNDSKKPKPCDGVRNIMMPYDSGISAGRNKALATVNSEFFLLLDDDFVFSRRQHLGQLVQTLKQYPAIDILGGRCIDLPFYIVHNVQDAPLTTDTTTDATIQSKTPQGTRFDNNVVVDKVTNYFIARTDQVRRIGWKEELKVFEHNDFFTRAKGQLTTAYNPDMLILHAKTPFDVDYLNKRFRRQSA